jgi:capsular polysaccharide transport system permease protein
MISRTLVVFFSYLVIGILILFASTYVVEWTPINDLGGVYLALLASPLLGFSIGVLLSSFAVIFPIINRIVNIVMRFAFFTSGVFFSADRFPQDIQELLLYNPAFQILELARNAFYFGYPTHTSSWTYIFSIIIICLSIGLVMERYVRSRRID